MLLEDVDLAELLPVLGDIILSSSALFLKFAGKVQGFTAELGLRSLGFQLQAAKFLLQSCNCLLKDKAALLALSLKLLSQCCGNSLNLFFIDDSREEVLLCSLPVSG